MGEILGKCALCNQKVYNDEDYKINKEPKALYHICCMDSMDKQHTELRESLSNFCHGSWSGWMDYLFSKSESNLDGTVTIPLDLVNRWKRQAITSYYDLPEDQQKSDGVEADKILEIWLKFQQDTFKKWNDFKHERKEIDKRYQQGTLQGKN